MFERVTKQLDVIRDEQENMKDMMNTFQINQQGNSKGNDQGSSGQWMGKPMSDEPLGIAGNDADSHPVGGYACLSCYNNGNDVALQPGEPTCPGCGGKNNWDVALI